MKPLVAVFIPTFRRPESLLRTLESLRFQRAFENVPIIVADNDQPAAEGAKRASHWASENGFEDRLVVVPAPVRGLSQCRNVGLAAAFACKDVIAVAMIDDDATASPMWYNYLIAAVTKYDPDLLGGPTLYSFTVPVPIWIQNVKMFSVPYKESGIVPSLWSANNCVISRRLYERFGPELFDSSFSLSGGEDVDLFARCRASRMRIAWCSDASVFEPLPPRRCTEEWVFQRHYASAVISVRVDHRVRGAFRAKIRQILLIIKELLGGVVKSLSPNPENRFVGRMRFRGVSGRLAGLMNADVEHN